MRWIIAKRSYLKTPPTVRQDASGQLSNASPGDSRTALLQAGLGARRSAGAAVGAVEVKMALVS